MTEVAAQSGLAINRTEDNALEAAIGSEVCGFRHALGITLQNVSHQTGWSVASKGVS